MFCPRCGTERASEETSFCSRCGYLLTATAELLSNDGVPAGREPVSSKPSPRWTGVKFGIFLMLLTLVIAPVIGIIVTFAFGIEPWPMGIVLFLGFGSGVLRIAYALLFEASRAESETDPAADRLMDSSTRRLTVGNESYISPDVARSPELHTNDLQREPHSVTDGTTRLLENEDR
jgi:uncharacterized integral membrane protein